MTGCHLITREDMDSLVMGLGYLALFGGLSGVLLFANVLETWDRFQWRYRRSARRRRLRAIRERVQ